MLLDLPLSARFGFTEIVETSIEYVTTYLPANYTSVNNVIEKVSGDDTSRDFAAGPVLTGKCYWEIKLLTGDNTDSYSGFIPDESVPSFDTTTGGSLALGLAWRGFGWFYQKGTIHTGFSQWSGVDQPQTLMFAFDADTDEFWEGVNGVWGSDPVTELGSWFLNFSSPRVAVNCYSVGCSVELTTSLSKLVYPLPSGFTTLDSAENYDFTPDGVPENFPMPSTIRSNSSYNLKGIFLKTLKDRMLTKLKMDTVGNQSGRFLVCNLRKEGANYKVRKVLYETASITMPDGIFTHVLPEAVRLVTGRDYGLIFVKDAGGSVSIPFLNDPKPIDNQGNFESLGYVRDNTPTVVYGSNLDISLSGIYVIEPVTEGVVTTIT